MLTAVSFTSDLRALETDKDLKCNKGGGMSGDGSTELPLLPITTLRHSHLKRDWIRQQSVSRLEL